MKKRYKLAALLCLITGGMRTAQAVSDEMDALPVVREVSYAPAARFALADIGVLPDDADSGTAFDTAFANKWPPKQTVADEMDALLAARQVSYAQAARFALAGAGVLPDDTDSGTAFDTAFANKWLPKKASADAPIKMGELSLLIMQAFKMKGGLMYTILPSRRYAYREMVYRKLYQGNVDPSLTVSGERLLTILAKVLTYTKADEDAGEVRGSAE